MKIENILPRILKDINVNIPVDNNNEGLKIKLDNEELVIQGDYSCLIELANYLVNIALTDKKGQHLHIDENTLVSNKSQIIIEKE